MIRPLVQDDIVAMATPPGVGALAVIRISGQKLKPLFKKITRSKNNPEPRYSNYKTIYNLDDTPIDNCLITYFNGPKSFTGEDVIEISSHGGEFIPKSILNMLYNIKVRQAAPGEFSYRAFLNGKIDLIQAESISGIILAKTTSNANVQLNNLNGQLSGAIDDIKNTIVHLLTILEHELDFSEEEIDFTKTEKIKNVLSSVRSTIEHILASYGFGSTINHGVKVVLCGKPNSGKSSLFNRLSGENRAIVTNVAGTTRDTLETWLEIAGIPVCIIDTAGLNDTNDAVESIGIEKSHSEITTSDVLLVLDEENPKEFYEQNKLNKLKKDIILIHTKIDLHSTSVNYENCINISVKKDLGIDMLYTELSTVLKKNLSYSYITDPVIMSSRQKHLLKKSLGVLSEAETTLRSDCDIIILSSLLREFIGYLEELLGKISNEDIFDKLFSSFCIGK